MNEIDGNPPYFQAESLLPTNPIILFDGDELKPWTAKALPYLVGIVNIFVALTRHYNSTDSKADQYLMFEAFLGKDQIEDLIKIAKYHAPTCTHFEQCHWDGCNE